jgi:acyl carrier protein
MSNVPIEETVKAFLLEEFMPGESPDVLDSATPLITGGILDSIGTLKLVTFLEETYDVRFDAHEVNEDNLDCLTDIGTILAEKLAEK